jgi:hypothetical protein
MLHTLNAFMPLLPKKVTILYQEELSIRYERMSIYL